MSNEIVVHTGSGLDITRDQEMWSERQLAALRQLGVQDASNADLAVFMHVAQRTGLDPFARQIYMIKRKGKQTIQTGIDGFRLIARRAADRNGETIAYRDTLWSDDGGNWSDVWLDDKPPRAAKVTVLRNGHPYPGVALWREYQQTDSPVWTQRPAGQLAKCAEALALRKAFPQDLAGLYTRDELRDEQPQVVRRVTAAEIRREPEPEPDPVTGEVQTEPTGYADPTAPLGPEPEGWGTPSETKPTGKP